jgi:hypothetical protein
MPLGRNYMADSEILSLCGFGPATCIFYIGNNLYPAHCTVYYIVKPLLNSKEFHAARAGRFCLKLVTLPHK